ncbi:MAG: ABC transporter ATP-binding protein, partial [Rhodobacteraceae bacterium]|nr:ABC transporter ATP-binding protein [Paracoccaceae bacterium]MCB2131438.1 ABC transporter ATP-binding protein [Paracoccaceae bacterium]MCB2140507.1 ABC transporter ATP-binding protein [Paracoccaceae bacterium]MCB2143363.1 ABC transporter ATP-binding protein [Paracoccaceae bacterium]MCB2150449.1 ABC transporter ATP-binding protein [Paracoccaceae bacterium]
MSDGAASGGLRLQALTKRFGSFTAVEDINLDIRRGEFLTLLGPSGSGKTTLLMMIAGFLDITAGDILLDGTSIAGMPPEKRNFGMVFQGYALFPHMTVRENIAYPLDVRKRPRAEIAARVDEMLDLVQLQDFGHRLPRQLSGGQQQRVALARALCFAPPVLLLDEPL